MTASSAGRSPWSARTPHRWPGCSARVAGGYRELHADHGVQLQLGTRVAGLRGTGRVEAVVTEDGRTVEGDLVLVGAGAVPRTGLAEAAGFAVRNGVLVNEQLEGVGVYAAGDVAAPGTPVTSATCGSSTGPMRAPGPGRGPQHARALAASGAPATTSTR